MDKDSPDQNNDYVSFNRIETVVQFSGQLELDELAYRGLLWMSRAQVGDP